MLLGGLGVDFVGTLISGTLIAAVWGTVAAARGATVAQVEASLRSFELATLMTLVGLDPDALVERTRAEGVLIGPVSRSGNVSRLVLHHQVGDAGVEAAIDVISRCAQALAGR